MLDVVGGVVVHAVEVIGAFYESGFFGGEGWETVSELLHHGGGIVAEVDGVCEPGDAEFKFSFGGFNVEGIGGIPRVDGVTCLFLAEVK